MPHWPRPVLQRLLPPNTALAIDEPDEHPVMLILGDLRSAELVFASVPLPTPLTARMLVLGVPVHCARDTVARLLVLRVYGSNPILTFCGLLAYGFAHRAASIDRDRARFVVHAPLGSELITVSACSDPSDWRPAGADGSLGALDNLLRLTAIVPRGESFVTWTWGWDLSSASIRDTRMRIVVSALFEHPVAVPPPPVDAAGVQVRNVGWWVSPPALLRP